MRARRLLMAGLWLGWVAGLLAPELHGQEGDSAGAASPGSAMRILAVEADGEGASNEAGLGDRVILTVEGLPQILARVGGECEQVYLFLDGLPLAQTPPESCNPEQGRVRYHLLRNDASDAAWHTLLGRPKGLTRLVPVGLGTSNDFALITLSGGLRLRIFHRAELWTFGALLVGALGIFVWLSRSTGLLRSSSADGLTSSASAPFSLARVQAAFWFFLVLGAYVFLFMVTEELDTISDSVLALIGIGSGTALGAAMIDGNAVPTRAASAGFWQDLLEGPGGLAFHRFQMVVWTLLLGLIFVLSVYRSLAMPEFSATLLGMLGISSGTYLGFKFPEREAAQKAEGEGQGPPST
ncbi:MAG TPA: hypothetical protein VF017_10175 [Thermoanaerobaculia bacterium]|nr:hypothetical protein [Thermoanaerobaculia bacterium]